MNKLERINNPMFLQMSVSEVSRFYQGLSFYHPIQHPGMGFLELCLENHKLKNSVKEVMKKLGTDVLKSFYLVKEAYLAKIQKIEYIGFNLQPDSSHSC